MDSLRGIKVNVFIVEEVKDVGRVIYKDIEVIRMRLKLIRRIDILYF